MASASSIWPLCAASLLLLAVVLSGCATTQDADKRASITADRTLASRKPLQLRGTDREVQVVRTSVIHGRDGSAIVVVLRNRGDSPVNDLPIEVGPEGGQPLNARPNVPYFQSHAPAIAPGARGDLGLRHQGPDRVEPRLRQGGRPRAEARDDSGSSLRARGGRLARPGGSSVQAEVTNDTGIPQYNLDVYAVARKGGRYVAAGRANLEHLGVDASAHLSLPLIGDARGTQVQVFAPQTLFE